MSEEGGEYMSEEGGEYMSEEGGDYMSEEGGEYGGWRVHECHGKLMSYYPKENQVYPCNTKHIDLEILIIELEFEAFKELAFPGVHVEGKIRGIGDLFMTIGRLTLLFSHSSLIMLVRFVTDVEFYVYGVLVFSDFPRTDFLHITHVTSVLGHMTFVSYRRLDSTPSPVSTKQRKLEMKQQKKRGFSFCFAGYFVTLLDLVECPTCLGFWNHIILGI
ncbi:hypothetical protein Btru_068934 [Bulinus truncatus]|nr:hypothetical protein Btru_068934 [Bulinus truncatus]